MVPFEIIVTVAFGLAVSWDYWAKLIYKITDKDASM